MSENAFQKMRREYVERRPKEGGFGDGLTDAIAGGCPA